MENIEEFFFLINLVDHFFLIVKYQLVRVNLHSEKYVNSTNHVSSTHST
jgi:hypothetical protein